MGLGPASLTQSLPGPTFKAPCYRDSHGLEIENGPGWMSALALTSEIQVVYLPTFSSGPWEMLDLFWRMA